MYRLNIAMFLLFAKNVEKIQRTLRNMNKKYFFSVLTSYNAHTIKILLKNYFKCFSFRFNKNYAAGFPRVRFSLYSLSIRQRFAQVTIVMDEIRL